MFKRLTDIILTIRIYIYMKFSDFIKKIKPKRRLIKTKSKDYAIAVFNNMTPSFMDALSDVLLDEQSLRLYFSSMSFIIIFRSDATPEIIEQRLAPVFKNDESAYLLTPLINSKLLIIGEHSRFMNLNDGNPLDISVDTLKQFFSVLDNLRTQIINQLPDDIETSQIIIHNASDINFEEKNTEVEDVPTDSEVIDSILDKINKTGIDSLDESELYILKKISKKYGKKD